MPEWKLLAGLLILSLILSGYLLFVLNSKIKPIYGEIAAWRLIFIGYVLMFIEILVGLVLVMQWLPVYVRFFNIGFCALMAIKVTCYVVGFSLWARNRHQLLDPKRWANPKGDD